MGSAKIFLKSKIFLKPNIIYYSISSIRKVKFLLKSKNFHKSNVLKLKNYSNMRSRVLIEMITYENHSSKTFNVCIGLALDIKKPTLGSFITFQELLKYDWHWCHAFLKTAPLGLKTHYILIAYSKNGIRKSQATFCKLFFFLMKISLGILI